MVSATIIHQCVETLMNFRNLALSLAAGNATLWKPSPSTPLCSIAVTKIVSSVLERNNIPGAVAGLVTGGKDVGAAVVESRDVDLGIIISLNSTLDTERVLVLASLLHRQRGCWPRSWQSCPKQIWKDPARTGWKQWYAAATAASS